MSNDLDIEIERRTAAGHEALLRDMAIPDPEMSVLAQKAAMFDELVDSLEEFLNYIDRGRHPLTYNIHSELLARASELQKVNK